MILDTNALSAFADGAPQLHTLVVRAPEINIPVIVLGEYRYGIAHSIKRKIYMTWLEENGHGFRLLNITELTAIEYAGIRSELRQSGKPIPANDVWIAALSREHNLPVISRDAHFDRVKGLRRIAW